MHTVEVDDDVWEDLVKNREGFETPSEQLRRRLGLHHTVKSKGADATQPHGLKEIAYILEDPAFKSAKTAKDRQMVVLARLHERHPEAFLKALALRGRKRQYFGKSKTELEAMSPSCAPRLIPGTDIYVITNTENPRKQIIISEVMGICGYRQPAVAMLTSYFPAGTRS